MKMLKIMGCPHCFKTKEAYISFDKAEMEGKDQHVTFFRCSDCDKEFYIDIAPLDGPIQGLKSKVV